MGVWIKRKTKWTKHGWGSKEAASFAAATEYNCHRLFGHGWTLSLVKLKTTQGPCLLARFKPWHLMNVCGVDDTWHCAIRGKRLVEIEKRGAVSYQSLPTRRLVLTQHNFRACYSVKLIHPVQEGRKNKTRDTRAVNTNEKIISTDQANKKSEDKSKVMKKR